MNSTRRGNALENRAIGILVDKFGYLLGAKAKRTPIYVNRPGVNSAGFVVGGGGADLIEGSTDAIMFKALPPAELLILQVTTMSGVSARRQKLRAVRDRLPLFAHLHIWAWDDELRAFRLFRDTPEAREDFLERGWRIDSKTDGIWPWDRPAPTTEQLTL